MYCMMQASAPFLHSVYRCSMIELSECFQPSLSVLNLQYILETCIYSPKDETTEVHVQRIASM